MLTFDPSLKNTALEMKPYPFGRVSVEVILSTEASVVTEIIALQDYEVDAQVTQIMLIKINIQP